MLYVILSILAPRSDARLEACEVRYQRRNPAADHDESPCATVGGAA